MALEATPVETPPAAPPPETGSPNKEPAATPASPEAKVEPPKPESASFLELKRQERAHREKVEAEKKARSSEKAALDKREAELAVKQAKFEEYERKLARAQADPLGFLKSAGLTEDAIAQAILSGQTPAQLVEETTVKLEGELEKKLEAKIEAKFEDKKKQDEAAQRDAIIADWSKQSVAELTAAAKTYPVLNALGLQQQVVNEMVRVYLEEGLDMTLEEAATKAEAYYKEQYEKAHAALEPAPAKPDEKAAATPAEKLAVKERAESFKATRREDKPVITNGMSPSVASASPVSEDWEAVKKRVLEKHGLK